jgi:hypothetical protein
VTKWVQKVKVSGVGVQVSALPAAKKKESLLENG